MTKVIVECPHCSTKNSVDVTKIHLARCSVCKGSLSVDERERTNTRPSGSGSGSKNYYEILELEAKCTEAEIKQAYRRLAKIYHPDVNGDEKKMKQIIEAYDVLGDPAKRKEYDESLIQASKSDELWDQFNIELKKPIHYVNPTELNNLMNENVELFFNMFKEESSTQLTSNEMNILKSNIHSALKAGYSFYNLEKRTLPRLKFERMCRKLQEYYSDDNNNREEDPPFSENFNSLGYRYVTELIKGFLPGMSNRNSNIYVRPISSSILWGYYLAILDNDLSGRQESAASYASSTNYSSARTKPKGSIGMSIVVGIIFSFITTPIGGIIAGLIYYHFFSKKRR